MSQADTNPYPYSDSNKRYMTYDWYLKTRFGGKVAKVPLDAGFTCPNIDGKRGCGGCVFCRNGSGSADGASISDQYMNGIRVMERKWNVKGFIPYLQAHTNTYADPDVLRRVYGECVSLPGAVMLSVATRADCLGQEVLDILDETAKTIPVTVELGLQSSDDGTAERINRCHTFEEFKNGYAKLAETAARVNSGCDRFTEKRLTVCVHIIDGLPGETRAEMMKTASDVASMAPDMLKIHLMCVLEGTPLGEMYSDGRYVPMDREGFVATVCDQIEIMPPKTVIARLTGDGPEDSLVAPAWSRRKTEVVNLIDRELYRRGTFQGVRFRGALLN